MKRRDFLRHLTVTGPSIAAMASFNRALAQSTSPKKILYIHAMGGWDPVAVLHPKANSNQFVDSNTSASILDFGLGGNSLPLRNAGGGVTAFFNAYAARTAVICGVDAETIGHAKGYQVNATGQTREGQPDLGTMIGETNKGQSEIPYFMFGGVPFVGKYARNMAMTGFSNQINELTQVQAAFTPSKNLQCLSYPGLPRCHIFPTDLRAAAYAPAAGEKGLLDNFFEEAANRFAADPANQSGLNKDFAGDFQINAQQVRKIEATNFGSTGFSISTADRLEQARLKLIRRTSESKASISVSALVATGENFDTHGGGGSSSNSSNQQQEQLHSAVFQALKDFLDKASDPAQSPGDTTAALADELIIVIASDFGRTPKFNASFGKDHWPVGATVVIGPGVSGGQSLGSSDDKCNANTINLATGLPDANGKKLQPRHIYRAVLELAGVDPDIWLPGISSFDALIA